VTLNIDGHSLTLADVARVAKDPAEGVALSPSGRAQLEAARALVERKIAGGERVYGVTTGFGRLAEVVIPEDQRVALQVNVIRSHAAGFGPTSSREAVRALSSRLDSEHDALHEVMDCLAEMIWNAQRHGAPFDNAGYLDCLERKR